MGQESNSKRWWQTVPAILAGLATFIGAVTGLIVALNQMGVFNGQERQQNRTSPAEKPGGITCLISGRVFDSDSNKPLSGVWVDLYRDLSSIQQRPQRLKAGVATTGLVGQFSINCSWVKDSRFPLLLAVRHRDWDATRITGPKIERSGEWDGINIPIPMSEVGLKALRELSVSFTTRKIDSDRFIIGEVENKSGRSFSCIKARFNMTTSHQDQLQGEPKRHLGFLDVEIRNIGSHEKKPYQKKLPRRIGISLHSKEEC